MFGKKCPNCRKKISREFEFCPYCGFDVSQKEGLLDEMGEEGELGINSREIEKLTKDIGKQMGVDFMGSFPFNIMINKLSREIEKQFKDIDKEMTLDKKKGKEPLIRKDGAEIKRTNFPGGFSVQIKLGGIPGETLRNFPEEVPLKKREEIAEKKSMSRMKQMKTSNLPKKEPETRVRRLTDKIIYEIDMPGVRSEKQISINKLENSIEIKAITKDVAYFKLLPVSQPLKKYYLKGEKLTLELSP